MVIHLIKNQKTLDIPLGYCIEWIDWMGKFINTVVMPCPNCSRLFSLRNHTIKNGNVSPSVVCPYSCGFHEFVQIQP